jgi:hypothetical protein
MHRYCVLQTRYFIIYLDKTRNIFTLHRTYTLPADLRVFVSFPHNGPRYADCRFEKVRKGKHR